MVKVIAALVAALSLAAGAATSADAAGRPAADGSIVDVALAVNAQTHQFDTLIALLTRYPDLVQVLDSRGQYTVFAPTDDAFAALFAVVDPATLTSDQVRDILLYHVAHGRRDAADVVSSSRIRMLNGDFASVAGASIDGQPIVLTDVMASNGIIHVVGGVLLPPAYS
jgi:uncharacterized surface protein with fasciclin (FAS1) repeats